MQVIYNQSSQEHSSSFDRSKSKFQRQMIVGILKSGEVQLNAIGLPLQRKWALRKTVKRLGFLLGGSLVAGQVNRWFEDAKRHYLKQFHQSIWDLSDIWKTWAE